MKNILVVGGCGFIGSHTLLQLAIENKYSITVFDSLVKGHKEILKRIEEKTSSKINFIEGSLLNKSDLENLFSNNQFDSVIHFAALIEAGVSMKHPAMFYENNVNGSINLLTTMQKYNVRKIVFSSTAAVYSNDAEMP